MRWRERLPKIFTWLGILGLVVGFLSGIGALSYFAESFPIWTGFNRIPEFDAQGNITKYVAAKTLWDWLNLLLIPLVLTGGGIWFTRSENRQAREIEQKRGQDAIVKDYLDQMTELLLSRGLRTSLEGDEVRSVARVRTLTALRGVDGMRKATIVQFLYESRLIGYIDDEENRFDAIVELRGADLIGVDLDAPNLRGVNLSGVLFIRSNLFGGDLTKANLLSADLTKANLFWANLSGANLYKASFRDADLFLCNLSGAYLVEADFSGATLRAADLSRTDLSGAYLSGADLREAHLDEATVREADLFYCRNITSDQLLQAKLLDDVTTLDHINTVNLDDLQSPPKDENIPEL